MERHAAATIHTGLEPYSIAEKLRALRLRKKIGLVELGEHTGLSPALLSKLERGKLIPTLPTLLRIAMVYSVGLEHFFAPQRRHLVAITRKSERRSFPERPNAPDAGYAFQCLDYPAPERKLNCYLAEFRAGGEVRPHTHAGIEFLYVVEGKLGLRIGSEEHALGEGDSIYFDSSALHSYRRAGKSKCSAVVVTTA